MANELFTARSSGTILIDSIAAKAEYEAWKVANPARFAEWKLDTAGVQGPPTQPLLKGLFDPDIGPWVELLRMRIPAGPPNTWIGACSVEIPAQTVVGTPLWMLAIEARTLGSPPTATCDILMISGVLSGHHDGRTDHLENFLWGGDGNLLIMWARQIVVPWWPNLGGLGSFKLANPRMSLSMVPSAENLARGCIQDDYHTLDGPTPHPYTEHIPRGTTTVSSNDGWVKLCGACPNLPGNCLASEPAALRVSCAPSTSADTPAGRPNAPEGTRLEVMLTHRKPNGGDGVDVVGQWIARTPPPTANPVGVDFPVVIPSLPAGNHTFEMFARLAPGRDGSEQFLTFGSPALWFQGVPNDGGAARAFTGQQTLLYNRGWLPLGIPLELELPANTVAHLTFTADVRSADPSSVVNIGFSLDGQPSGDRGNVVQNVGTRFPVTIASQESVALSAGKHTVQAWAITETTVPNSPGLTVIENVRVGVMAQTG
jgi:hypothetical protein